MQNKKSNYLINQSPIYKLRSRSKLARILGISPSELRRISAGDSLYREFDIPKKNGGVRRVENPGRPLKLAQAKIARILSRIEPPDYLYCPVKGRCYVSNAAQHVGNRVIRCLDIKKYFPSTPARRVFWFYHKILKCERDIAGLLTALTTYQQHLPTGSPLSPIMAFFAYYDAWEEIAGFCRRNGYTLTVYVDDCTISGTKVPEKDVWEIKRIIHGAGLKYHKEKSYIDRPAEITGVIVGRDGLSVPNRQFLKLKNATSEFSIDGGRADLRDQILGLRGQMQQISKLKNDLA